MLVVNIIAILNVVTLFAFLFFKRNNPLPNKILAFIFLIPGFYFVTNILVLTNQIQSVPFSFFFAQIIAILFPILIIRYVYLLLGEKRKIPLLLIAGSLLLLCYILLLTVLFFIKTAAEREAYILRLADEDNYPLDMMLYTVFFYLWQLAYFSSMTLSVFKYSKKVYDTISNIESTKLTYLKKFVSLFWVLNLILAVMYIVLPVYLVDYFYLPVTVNIIYIFIIYFSYNYNAIFTNESFTTLQTGNVEIEATEEKHSEKKPAGFIQKNSAIADKLNDVLEKKKIYVNTNLNIKMLSESIEEPPYLVSKTINSFFNKSFFDLINEYRINEAKARLIDPKYANYTVEAIGEEVGFKSRSSFFSTFKKYTAFTPAEFKKTNTDYTST